MNPRRVTFLNELIGYLPLTSPAPVNKPASPSSRRTAFAGYLELFNPCVFATDPILKDPDSLWFTNRSRYDLICKSLQEVCDELEKSHGHRRMALGKTPWLASKSLTGTREPPQSFARYRTVSIPGRQRNDNMGFYRHLNPFTPTVGASFHHRYGPF